MPDTLSATYSSVVTLNVAADDPATITANGLLSGGLAAKSLSQAWIIANAGRIDGQGVQVYNSAGTITNTGTIAGSNQGIYLRVGGAVTNASTGTITGGTEGIYGGGAPVIVSNAGYIAGPGFSGIKLLSGGTVGNTGTITGSVAGVLIGGGSGEVSNSNVISGSQGVYLQAGGAVTNLSHGTISGGVYIYGGPGYVSNASLGLITASHGIVIYGGAGTIDNGGIVAGTNRGIFLRGGGSVTNAPGGTITGGNYGIFINGGTGAVSNAGSIAGSSYFGINLFHGGSVSNASTGSITGGHGGIYVTGGAGTVSNDGRLIGTGNPSYGIKLNDGGTVTNTGSIVGVSEGIFVNTGAGTVGNTGSIASTSNQGNAVLLLHGGYVSNASIGSISGGSKGIVVSGGAGSVNNAGSIAAGASGSGINFSAGGTIANVSGGSISGSTAIVVGGGASTIDNSGSIGGGQVGIQMSVGAAGLIVNEFGGSISGNSQDGIFILTGGSISNASGGSITGGGAGIFVYNGAATITNGGAIAASRSGSDGIDSNDGVTVGNVSGGSIAGQNYGIAVGGAPGYIVNTGSIAGNDAIYFSAGGTVANQSGGVIAGIQNGIFVASGGAIVTNGGSISGATDAIRFAGGNTNRLIIDPGASFIGVVQGGNAVGAGSVSTLELASAAATGTLTGLGTQFVNFVQITIDAGAYWTLDGANSLASGIDLTNAGTLTFQNATLTGAGSVANDGTIFIDPSSVTISALTGTGSVSIEAGSTLDVTGAVAGGETIVFAANTGSLVLSPTVFSGQIDGFQAGDTIDLSGVTDATSASIVSTNTLQVLRSGHTAIDLTLDIGRSFAGDTFGVTPNGFLTTDAEAPCFLRGTLIRTERGDVPVEDLTIGMRVRTMSGTLRPIAWIGSGEVLVTPGKRSAATPVVVRKSALSGNVPFADLRITKGHALFIDGVLIPAEFLVNHRTILWDDHRRHVEFYHIELATHDVLIANGAESESYRDDGNRWMFQNENDTWDHAAKPPCAPVLTGGPIVDAVWRRLLERDRHRATMATTDDPDLHLLVDGQRVDSGPSRGATRMFRLTDRPRTVRIVSRAASPAETGLGRDARSLGVAVARVTLNKTTRIRVMEAASPALSDGFHAFEAELGLRWTDGDATLPSALFHGFDGAIDLEVRLGGSTQYPAHSEAVARPG
ncbi:MAG TPA: Hint domain-containing protein [Acetobacteraceae bacterium]|jgi:hypothetical protein